MTTQTTLDPRSTPDTGGALDSRFDGEMVKDAAIGGWTYVLVPDSVALLGTGNPVRVSGTVDGHPVQATLMPLGGGRHMLPLKAAVRKAIGKEAGAEVAVHLERRLDR